MEDFYFVADYTSRFYLDVDNILFSASTSFLKSKKWHDWTGLDPQKTFIDSGGYSFFRRWGEYPFSIAKYIEFIYILKDDNMYPITLCAIRDYPCEPDINRSQISTNKERIQKTVSNAVECFQADGNLPWIPVIQGYTIEEYLSCIQLYEDVGIPLDYIAVGSLCSRKGNLHEIRKILTTIKQRTGAKLHSFGLSLVYLKDPIIFNTLYSSDSAAWNYRVFSHDDKQEAVRTYQTKLSLLSNNHIQETLV